MKQGTKIIVWERKIKKHEAVFIAFYNNKIVVEENGYPQFYSNWKPSFPSKNK